MAAAVALPSFEDVVAAGERIREHVVRTPVLTSAELDAACGHKVFLKCETMQRTGSFKHRGATNAVFSLSEEAAARGVVCHSSGNHGAATAAAARARGVPAVVVVPRTTAQVKIDNIKAFGGEVVLCEPTQAARQQTAAAEAARLGGAAVIHPYNQAEVIAGQGTIGLELMDQVPDLDTVLVPTSGGGMLTGIALAVGGRRGGACRVRAVEPAGKRLGDAFRAGQRVLDPTLANSALDTVCDAMPTRSLGELPWALAHERGLVSQEVCTVRDEQVIGAMRYVFETLKLVVEPAAATGIAALLAGQVQPKGQRVGVVLCGGNVDVRQPLPWQVPAPAAHDDADAEAKRRRVA